MEWVIVQTLFNENSGILFVGHALLQRSGGNTLVHGPLGFRDIQGLGFKVTGKLKTGLLLRK